ncbi:NADH-quinone oxidoreductase subunit N [Virgisporangium aliadipatigenens]|uniref:NADH-quinone oxidoreductase subunit N n=1 Tax=Virgisporangium aliadipatigenens TaxID=741659 RepID=A0A8J3YIM6_9ACTN|nr:NADH-quinone oxidoreductase subunit N [Virgisporangium aliadipatigenens]GIJ44631.1 NADH-quinone oxidoreductase subunit N [Virgisporangium aliadipatigenens]
MIDHVALLPAYLAAGTAVLVLVADLLKPVPPAVRETPRRVTVRGGVLAGVGAATGTGRALPSQSTVDAAPSDAAPSDAAPSDGSAGGRSAGPAADAGGVALFWRRLPLIVGAVGALAVAVSAAWLGLGLDGRVRTAFCGGAEAPDCSFAVDARATTLMAAFGLITLAVLALSAGVDAPPGEYAFLLVASMTGGVVLAGAADLITLIVALETLTLPLYVLVGLRRRPERAVESGQAAVTFLVVSVISTAISLLGAALVYAATGAIHFGAVRMVSNAVVDPALRPIATAGTVLLLAGLAFKVAAVPLHAWAPTTYDGAPLPVAAYLSTASKFGGVIAIGYVVTKALPAATDVTGPTLAVLAVLTMTVGNLVALRQTRMVRLLAWSSIAQAGYIVAALAVPGGLAVAFGYTVFFVLLELAAFGGIIGTRGPGADGGNLDDYAGLVRRAPARAVVIGLALAGLAGLPPGIAGLFAKVAVVRVLVDGDATWLAVVVAINAVIGLAYYVRAARILFTGPSGGRLERPSWTVAAALTLLTAAGLVAGFAPQLVFDLVVWS